MNTPQFTYLRAWWRPNCVTSYVTKLTCYLHSAVREIETTVACCIRPNRLFAGVAESGPMFTIFKYYW